MDELYGCKRYTDYIQSVLDQLRKTQGRGAIRRLSEFLGCHPTFISQVLKEKAHFSQDQALKFCRFANLEIAETEFFLNLVSLQRAGTKEARDFFNASIKRQLEARTDLKTRWQNQNATISEHETLYFTSWLLQMVHALTQMSSAQNAKSISLALGAKPAEVESCLETLKNMKLVEQNGKSWKSTENFLHLAKSSPLINSFHLQWRQRISMEFMNKKSVPGTHYSGVLTFSEDLIDPIRQELISTLDSIMRKIKPSPCETAYALAVDFLPLIG